MAIAITEPVAEIASTSNNASYAFGSFTPAANALLVVLAAIRGTTVAKSMANTSGTALAWNTGATATFNAGADTMYVFWAVTPASTAPSVYTITSSAGTGCIAFMYSTTGSFDPDNPIRRQLFNSGTSANPTTGTIAAVLTSSGCLAAWWGALSSSNPANVSTPPGSWTEDGDAGFATPTTNGSAAHRATGETGTAVAFTAASTTWGLGFVEIYDLAVAPPLLTNNARVMISNP